MMSTATWTDEGARALLARMFEAAVAAADPRTVLAASLPEKPSGRCVVVGAGKAAASMAAAVEAAWPDVALSGVVVCPYGSSLPTTRIKVMESRHPVPDENSQAAAKAMLEAVAGLSGDDLVLALISGGGSSLMALPVDGLTLEDKQAVNKALLRSGLDIRTMNAVRRRLSAIKGGKLAAAASPARVVTLGVSDIPGDDPAAIASGPTIPDPTARDDLGEVAARLGDAIPERARRLLLQPGVAVRAPVDFRMIATPAMALEAAAKVARDEGLRIEMLGDAIEGEASAVGAQMADKALAADGPVVLLSGGETTVTLAGVKPGRGGRNTEFLLALMLALDGAAGVWALAADTDGEDGASGAAGAIAGPDSLERARALGLHAQASQAGHDSATLFAGLDDLLLTGPTYTNVNDFRAVLVAR